MNKSLIPVSLVAAIAIASIFAFMPVEKVSTVHGSLTTNLESSVDNQDRAIYFEINMSKTADKGVHTIIPAASGKDLSGSALISVAPNNSTISTVMSTMECGLIEVGNSTPTKLAINATRGLPDNGTFTTTTGTGIAVQLSRSTSSHGGLCFGTIFLNSGDE